MKHFYFFLIISILFISCSEKTVKKSVHSGAQFNLAIEQAPTSFIASQINDYYSAVVVSNIKEGLVAIDLKTLKIIPQLAEKYEIKNHGLTYEFTLRAHVLFHPSPNFSSDEDRLLTVEDVISSIEFACKKEKTNVSYAYQFVYKNKLKGADDFHIGKTKSISGIQTKGNTITLTLLKKDANFLYKLANVCAAIHSKKLLAKKDLNFIGTGPFQLLANSKQKIQLVRNEAYYQIDKEGCQLPYLDGVNYHVINSKNKQLADFEAKKLNIITGLPSDQITKILEGRFQDFNAKPAVLVLQDNPLLFSNYYLFNMQDQRLKNVKVRQAINYAIDKEKIGSKILKFQYNQMGIYGITPPVFSIFKGYNFNEIKKNGYAYNPSLARKLFAEAGYPDGKGFGSLELRFDIGDVNSKIADEIATQLFEVLKINVNLDGSTFEQLNKDASNGTLEMFRGAWSADYPSPESFLSIFDSKNIHKDKETGNSLNQCNYNNPKFDYYYHAALNSNSQAKAYQLFEKAEIELLKNPPLIPLWYNGDFQIIYGNVKNFQFNAMRFFSFKEVYIGD